MRQRLGLWSRFVVEFHEAFRRHDVSVRKVASPPSIFDRGVLCSCIDCDWEYAC